MNADPAGLLVGHHAWSIKFKESVFRIWLLGILWASHAEGTLFLQCVIVAMSQTLLFDKILMWVLERI
jgi:hypothetical protein